MGADCGFSASELNESFKRNFDKLNCLTADRVISYEEFGPGRQILALDDQAKMSIVQANSNVIKNLSLDESFGETGVSLADMEKLDRLSSVSGPHRKAMISLNEENNQMKSFGDLGKAVGYVGSVAAFCAGMLLLGRIPQIGRRLQSAAYAGSWLTIVGLVSQNPTVKNAATNIYDVLMGNNMKLGQEIGSAYGKVHASKTAYKFVDQTLSVMDQLKESGLRR